MNVQREPWIPCEMIRMIRLNVQDTRFERGEDLCKCFLHEYDPELVNHSRLEIAIEFKFFQPLPFNIFTSLTFLPDA